MLRSSRLTFNVNASAQAAVARDVKKLGFIRRWAFKVKRILERDRKIDRLAHEVDHIISLRLSPSYRRVLDIGTIMLMLPPWYLVWYGHWQLAWLLFRYPGFATQEQFDAFFDDMHPALLGFGHIMIFVAIYEGFRFIKYPLAKRVMAPFWEARGWVRIRSGGPATECVAKSRTSAAAGTTSTRRGASRAKR